MINARVNASSCECGKDSMQLVPVGLRAPGCLMQGVDGWQPWKRNCGVAWRTGVGGTETEGPMGTQEQKPDRTREIQSTVDFPAWPDARLIFK